MISEKKGEKRAIVFKSAMFMLLIFSFLGFVMTLLGIISATFVTGATITAKWWGVFFVVVALELIACYVLEHFSRERRDEDL